MIIEITKCSGIGYWYRDMIGNIYNAEKLHPEKFKITDKINKGCVSFVDVSDAKIFNENKNARREGGEIKP